MLAGYVDGELAFELEHDGRDQDRPWTLYRYPGPVKETHTSRNVAKRAAQATFAGSKQITWRSSLDRRPFS